MSLDFHQVHQQVRQLGENAPLRQRKLQALRERASRLLSANAEQQEHLRRKVAELVEGYDPNLRCALPQAEALTSHRPLPPLPAAATLIAADGSQINPDRHQAVEYGLINVGAIQMRYGSSHAPTTWTRCSLLYDEALYTPTGTLTDSAVALRRDLSERQALVELAAQAAPPVITFTDGPMELWGAKDNDGAAEFQQSLQAYLAVLTQLRDLGVTTAGYVDKPGADLVVRLLEVAAAAPADLPNLKHSRPLRGVTDTDLYRETLAPGERSAVFAIQSQSAANYRGDLALHFFYLNVGHKDRPWLARVEIPAWVAADPARLDDLHAVLMHQAGILGGRPYPYLLHRAHEVAVVTQEDRAQVTQMIELELRRRGVPVGEVSHKQANKDLPRRARYANR